MIELLPEEKHVNNIVGKRSALVIQSNHIYAFDPYGPDSVNILISGNRIPSGCNLKQNHPNPFNSSITIEYETERPSRAIITIYNTLAQEVRTLVNENQSAGEKSVLSVTSCFRIKEQSNVFYL
ncbi:MAG: hypothetical protein JXA39_06370 [Bacteroidales bacterium]|nr:hypothetical protein [Bacteroidales bacterium]